MSLRGDLKALCFSFSGTTSCTELPLQRCRLGFSQKHCLKSPLTTEAKLQDHADFVPTRVLDNKREQSGEELCLARGGCRNREWLGL